MCGDGQGTLPPMTTASGPLNLRGSRVQTVVTFLTLVYAALYLLRHLLIKPFHVILTSQGHPELVKSKSKRETLSDLGTFSVCLKISKIPMAGGWLLFLFFVVWGFCWCCCFLFFVCFLPLFCCKRIKAVTETL